MKILVVNWQDRLNPQAGGAETHLHEVFGRLAYRGHDVTLLVSGWKGAQSTDYLDGMKVVRAGGRYTFNLAVIPAWRRHLAWQRFDIVIEDLNKVPVFTPQWQPNPVVLLVHHLFGTTAFGEANPILAGATWLMERTLPLMYRTLPIVSVSESTRDDMVQRGFDRSQIAVIPNGVDLSYYQYDGDVSRFEVPTFLYLGRLKKYKRIDVIIRAVAFLKNQGCDCRFIIAGKGDYEQKLRALANDLDVADRIEFSGFVDEAKKLMLMRRAWAKIVVSAKEGWGIANVEAAACGTPTIATDVPGLRESVKHDVSGYLVPYNDYSALAARMLHLINDAEVRNRLGEGASTFARQFGWEHASEQMEEYLIARLNNMGGRRNRIKGN